MSSCVLIIILLLHVANVLATTKDVLFVRKTVCQHQLTNPIALWREQITALLPHHTSLLFLDDCCFMCIRSFELISLWYITEMLPYFFSGIIVRFLVQIK